MIIREQRCTSTVKSKLIKVNCSDNYGNAPAGPGRFLGLTLVYREWLKSILSHNKHGVFARKYVNEEIPMTSKLFIVMAQCAIQLSNLQELSCQFSRQGTKSKSKVE